MPRGPRNAPGGIVFHVLNRSNGRVPIFEKDGDFKAFEQVLTESISKFRMRLLAYCVLSNHWHMVLWPREDGDLAAFMQRLTTTHARRWHGHRHSTGGGHIYQGTYKSFPVQDDEHLFTVLRYVERNPLRAGLVKRAQDWPWSSLWCRGRNPAPADKPTLTPWPIKEPRDWLARVNGAETLEELEALRVSVRRGRPFGSESWQQHAAATLGLESAFRPRGRPPKREEQAKGQRQTP